MNPEESLHAKLVEIDSYRQKFIVGAITYTAAWVLAMRLQMPPVACAYFARQAGRMGACGVAIGMVQNEYGLKP